MRILVTGASGFVGSHLCAQLSSHEVFRVVRDEGETSDEHTVVADLRLGVPADRLPARVDAVVHLAQPGSGEPDRSRAEHAVNVEATQELARYAVFANARAFLFASTGNVYRRSTQPHLESESLDTTSDDPYIRAKILGEDAAQRSAADLMVVIARLFVPYGPGQSGRRMIPALARRIIDGIPVRLVNGGQPATNPIHIDDLCLQLEALLTSGTPRLVNLAGTEVRTIRELALSLAASIGREVVFVAESDADRFDLVGDASVAERSTGIRPSVPLERGLREVALTIRDGLGGAALGRPQ